MGRKRSTGLTLAEKKRIEILLADGRTCSAIGRTLGRDRGTIKSYVERPEVAAIVRANKVELAAMYEDLAKRMVGSITEEDIEKLDAYRRTIASAAATDKARLLRGESTANLFGGSLIALVQAADRQITGGSYPGATVDASFSELTPNGQLTDGGTKVAGSGTPPPPLGAGTRPSGDGSDEGGKGKGSDES